MTKMRGWIVTMTDGSVQRYLLDTEQGPNAVAVVAMLRDTWGMPAVAARDQLNAGERAEFGEDVAGMLEAMKE